MEFFEFLSKQKDFRYLYYNENKFYVFFNSPRITRSSFVLTDLVPFVIDIPAELIRGRFGGKSNSNFDYLENEEKRYRERLVNENIYDFIDRASRALEIKDV